MPWPIVVMIVAIVLITRGPWGRRHSRPRGPATLELETIEHIQLLEARVADLEERLDFAERLLAKPEAGGRGDG